MPRNRLSIKLVNSSLSDSMNEKLSLKEAPEESLALNEVVINRGPSPFLSNLDLYINDYLITTVQGDGLIVSTPTGSTGKQKSCEDFKIK